MGNEKWGRQPEEMEWGMSNITRITPRIEAEKGLNVSRHAILKR